MGTFWSIGEIRGLFQPDSFDEKQETSVGRLPLVGGVEIVQFKHWSAREVSLKFLVSAVDAPDSTNESVRSGNVDDCDPEKVWAKIIEFQRPAAGGLPQEIIVTIPGWGSGSHSADINSNSTTEVKYSREYKKEGGGLGRQGQRVEKNVLQSGVGAYPTRAIIKSASIERTHIMANGAAIRANISVTLIESQEINLDPTS